MSMTAYSAATIFFNACFREVCRESDVGTQRRRGCTALLANPWRDQSVRDIPHAIAWETLRRLDLEGRNVPSTLEDFIDGTSAKIAN